MYVYMSACRVCVYEYMSACVCARKDGWGERGALGTTATYGWGG